MPPRPNFGPFWAPKETKMGAFGHFLKIFSLISHQYCFTCSLQLPLEVCETWASEAQFFLPLQSFYFLSKTVPLNTHQSCFKCSLELLSEMSSFTCQFELLLDVCWISASEARLPGHLWPINISHFRYSDIFSIIFHCFHIILVLHTYLGYFKAYFKDVLYRPYF